MDLERDKAQSEMGPPSLSICLAVLRSVSACRCRCAVQSNKLLLYVIKLADYIRRVKIKHKLSAITEELEPTESVT